MRFEVLEALAARRLQRFRVVLGGGDADGRQLSASVKAATTAWTAVQAGATTSATVV